MRAVLDFSMRVRQKTVMKALTFLSFLGLFFVLTGCASDPRPRPVPMPPEHPETTPVDPESESIVPDSIGEDVDVPVLAEGVRLFHEGDEISMGPLVRGEIAEGSLIQISARSDVRHSVVSEMLMKLHSMGYLVGIRAEGVGQ